MIVPGANGLLQEADVLAAEQTIKGTNRQASEPRYLIHTVYPMRYTYLKTIYVYRYIRARDLTFHRLG